MEKASRIAATEYPAFSFLKSGMASAIGFSVSMAEAASRRQNIAYGGWIEKWSRLANSFNRFQLKNQLQKQKILPRSGDAE